MPVFPVLAAFVGVLAVSGSINGSASSVLSVEEYFYVTGHVKHPGRYVFEKGMTVSDGIIKAGDFVAPDRDHVLTVIRQVEGRSAKLPIALAEPLVPSDTVDVRNAPAPQRWSMANHGMQPELRLRRGGVKVGEDRTDSAGENPSGKCPRQVVFPRQGLPPRQVVRPRLLCREWQ